MAKTINLEDFFTEDHEKEGVWFEPKVKGIGCGIELLVTGTGTDENIVAAEHYDKESAELENIKDPIERVRKQKALDANRVAEFVKGIRVVEGCDVKFNGGKFEYSVPLIQQLMLKSPLIRNEVIRFVRDTTNFIKREKNA